MDMTNYDVIYKERVYGCISGMLTFDEYPDLGKMIRPKAIQITCFDIDGDIVQIHDEAFMFRFIRKTPRKGGDE